MENSGFNFIEEEKRSEFCTHCLNACLDLIPSPLNAKDMFCSKTCLENAMNSYHPLESQVLTHLETAELTQKEWTIALRAVLSKPLCFFLENRKEFAEGSQNKLYPAEMEEGKVFASNSFKSLFSLVSIRHPVRCLCKLISL